MNTCIDLVIRSNNIIIEEESRHGLLFFYVKNMVS